MSWVLSCTYEQLKEYPAKIILDFIRGLQLSIGSMVSFDDTGPKIVRIHPSIDALQLAMAYVWQLSPPIHFVFSVNEKEKTRMHRCTDPRHMGGSSQLVSSQVNSKLPLLWILC